MSMLFQIAWRNVWRNGRRTWITAIAMAVSVAICIFLSAFTNGFYVTFFDLLVTQKMGHIQIQHPVYAKEKVLHDTVHNGDELIQSIRQLDGVQGVSAKLYGNMLVSGSSESAGAQVVGVFPEVEQQDRNAASQIIEGRYLAKEPLKEVVVGTTLFDDLDLKLGEELFVYTQASDGSMAYDLYNLVGVYKTGATMLDNGMQFHVKDLQELLILPSQYHEILVVDDSLEHISTLQTEIQELLSDDDNVQVKTWWETSPQTKEMMSFQDVSSVLYLGIIFFIAGFGILNTMLMAVFERTRELGVMKALGMRAGQIIQVIIVESVVLATLASVLGLLMGVGFNFYLQEVGIDLSGGTGEPLAMMGINFDPIMYVSMQWSTYPLPVVGLFVVAVLSSVWPAFRASNLHPVDAIRSE